jgi:uncharacterized protein YfiM (DUF2279 family)
MSGAEQTANGRLVRSLSFQASAIRLTFAHEGTEARGSEVGFQMADSKERRSETKQQRSAGQSWSWERIGKTDLNYA